VAVRKRARPMGVAAVTRRVADVQRVWATAKLKAGGLSMGADAACLVE
jgi:hypothetical protein